MNLLMLEKIQQLLQFGEVEQSLKWLEVALKEDPNDSEALYLRWSIQLRILPSTEENATLLEASLSQIKQAAPQDYLILARRFPRLASTALAYATSIAPHDPDVIQQMVQQALAMKQFDQARLALEHFPSSLEYWEIRLQVALAQNDPQEIIECATNALLWLDGRNYDKFFDRPARSIFLLQRCMTRIAIVEDLHLALRDLEKADLCNTGDPVIPMLFATLELIQEDSADMRENLLETFSTVPQALADEWVEFLQEVQHDHIREFLKAEGASLLEHKT